VPRTTRYAALITGCLLITELANRVLMLAFPALAPFIRYLLLVAVAKVAGDVVYYALQPRRRRYQYPGDYLVNEMLPLYMWALPMCAAQRYLLVKVALPVAAIVFLNSAVPAVALYIYVRWEQELEEDRSHRIGGRAEKRGEVGEG